MDTTTQLDVGNWELSCLPSHSLVGGWRKAKTRWQFVVLGGWIQYQLGGIQEVERTGSPPPPPPVSSKRKSLYSVLPDFRIQHSQCQPLGLFSLSTANPWIGITLQWQACDLTWFVRRDSYKWLCISKDREIIYSLRVRNIQDQYCHGVFGFAFLLFSFLTAVGNTTQQILWR